MVHTTEHHTVVLRLGFSSVLNDLGTLETKLLTALQHANSSSPFYPHFAELVTTLRLNIHQLKTHTVDYFATFKGYEKPKEGRVKRSSLIGTFAARILGLATDEDLDSLVNLVNSNSKKEEGIINRAVSTMKITATHLRKVDLAVNKVNLAVKSMKNHFQKLDSNLAKLDSAFVLSEALTFFTASVDAVDRTVRQTLLDLQEVRLTAKVSSSLFPPSRLQKILQDLLNHQLSLVFPPTLSYLPNYFEILSATVRMSKLDFLIFVRVPLQTDAYYDLYRLRPFAVPYKDSKWSRRVTDIPEYLGIRADRKVAMAMRDLSNCLPTGDRYLCYPKSHFISTTQPSCPLALFQQNELVESQCTFQYAYDIPTEFVRIFDRWVGTSHSAQKAEEVCSNYTKTIMIPAGLSSIPVKAGCKIITADFVLPPFGLQGSSNLTLQVISHPLNSTPLAHLEQRGQRQQQHQRQYHQQQQQPRGRGNDNRIGPCHTCGRLGHRRQECHYSGFSCHNCGRPGHLASVCRQWQQKKNANTAPAPTRSVPLLPHRCEPHSCCSSVYSEYNPWQLKCRDDASWTSTTTPRPTGISLPRCMDPPLGNHHHASPPAATTTLDPLAKIELQDLKPFKDADLKFLKLRQAIYPAAYWSSSNSSHLALTIIITIGLIAVASYLTFLRCRARAYATEVRTRPTPARRNNARLSPINFFNRLPSGFPSPRPQMQNSNTSTQSSLTASPPSTPGAPLAHAPATPTTTPTRSPTPIPSMSSNTLRVPEIRLTPPTGEVEMNYLEMVIIV